MKVLKLSGIVLLMAIALTSCTNKKECFCEVVAYEDEYILGVLYEDVFYTERNEIVETGKECYEINETDFSDGTQDLMYEASRYYYNCQEF
ncbi:MAG: hypothetical protein UH543_07645 [Bacteroidales bacterium]|nr:hypothetical protein [Bacteroidales bacterium]